MTVIAGIAGMLKLHGDTMAPEERAGILERIVANTDRLADLVSDVLDVARIDSGDLRYELAPFDLAASIRRIAEDESITQSERVCRLDIPDDMPLGFGDENRYWRVLTNLLSNAFKFSPAAAPVELGVSAGEKELQVCVHDHGPGIQTS